MARLSLPFDTCEGHAESIEFCGRRLVFGARKYIYLLAPSDSVKTDTIQNPGPLCILQSTSDSARPQFNVIFGTLRDLLVNNDVGDLKPSPGLQDAMYLSHHHLLVWTEV